MSRHLTDAIVKSLAPPDKGYRIEWDTKLKRFGVRITSTGARSFVLAYRARRVQRTLTIGSYPDWGTAAARNEAARMKRDIDMGRDPVGERHEERAAPTVSDLCVRYIDEHASQKRASSRAGDQGLIEQWIKPELGRRLVLDIQHEDIKALHRKITKHGTPYRANRALALLSKMLNLSIMWKMRADNPAKSVEKNQEMKRTRFLTPDELRRLALVLSEHKNRKSVNAIRLLLLTGARCGEVLNAEWTQFDLDAGNWTKPSHLTKQKKEHCVPLSAPAMALLAEMKSGGTADAIYLFPRRPGKKPFPSLSKFWADVCRRAELRGVRIHDLRHSYASILASAGLSLPTIGALLGHTQASTTQRYAHLHDDPLREATERVGAIVTAARTGKTAEIVPLGKHKR